MIFSEKKYLSICYQTGLSFNLGLTLDNVTGNCNFGFTGENKNLNFKLESGRVFDPENRLIYFYDKDETVQISGNISRSNYSYYINENLLCSNGKKNNFVISGYYINPSNCKADLNIDIFGTRPNYELYLNSDFYIEQGNYISGNIKNLNNINFQIYSGSISIPENFTINSLPSFVYDTGYFTIDHYVNTSNQIEMEKGYEIKLNLFTNFGEITKNFITTGSYQEKIYLNLSLTDITNYLSRTGAQNALGDFKDNEFYINFIYNSGIKSGGANLNKYLSIDLKYSGGVTGEITGNIFASGYKNFTLTNYIIESGYLTGTTTLAATGYHALSGVYITGFISGSRSEFSYFTGYAVDNTTVRSLTGYYLNTPFVRNQTFPLSGFTYTGKYHYEGSIYDLDRLTNIKSVVNDGFNDGGPDYDIIKTNSSGTITLINSFSAPSVNYSTGTVDIYTGNGANFIKAITYSGLKDDTEFGRDISINRKGDIFTISSLRGKFVNTILPATGRVYIFTGINENINTVPYIEQSGYFYGYGYSAGGTALNSGNILVIGNGAANRNSGIVDIYKNIGSSWQKNKTISGLLSGSSFGMSVSINDKGDIILVGAPFTFGNAGSTGYAYIITGDNDLNNYNIKTTLTGLNQANDFFGNFTSLNKQGNIALVSPIASSGYICVYTGNKNNFIKTNVINYPGNNLADLSLNYFGFKAKLNDSGDSLIASAPYDNDTYGSAYVYSGNNNTWTNTKRIDPFEATPSPNILFTINNFITLDNKNTYFTKIYNVSAEIFTYLDYSGYINEYIIGAGNISNTNNYLFTGLLTGQKYTKTFTGAFNVITGYVVNGIITGLTDFQINNKIILDRYNSTGLINSGIDNLYIKIKTRNYFDNDNITGILTLSGYDIDKKTFSLVTQYITGIK